MAGKPEKSALDRLRQELRDAGLRATSSRLAVLQVLRRARRPLSHGDVLERLDEAAWDQATIYRNLTDLTDAGLLRRAVFEDRVWRFEQTDAEAHDPMAHPHFVCVSCGQVQCLPGVEMRVSSAGDAPGALTNGTSEVVVRGRCDDCA